jgi:hypothetical protein
MTVHRLELSMKSAAVFSIVLLTAAAGAQDSSTVISENGVGEIAVGLSVDRLTLVLHSPVGYNQYDNGGCSTITTKQMEPTGISLQIEKKILTRVNVDFYATDPRPLTWKTAAGIGLGSSEADLLKAYPKARIKPNPADPTWHTVFVDSADGKRAMVFETNGVSVKSIRVGDYVAVIRSTGCN